jgi:hypothetical protein
MNKYLLAGSLSLLSLAAGVVPVHAAEVASSEVQAAELFEPAAVPSSAVNSALLTVQPAVPAPETVTFSSSPSGLVPMAVPGALIADAAQTESSAPEEAFSINQVTSVTQLSDLKPTDWAYQAVQSLVERYGCIVGYPNSTFRGNRAATRFELAAALNACLDVISDRFATKEDLATLRRLQEEFAKELATLKGRVNGLEARTAKLEAQQFSTTTKLQGTAVMSFQAGAATGTFVASDLSALGSLDTNPTIISAALLSLNTSFSGSDLLQVTLGMGNNGQDTIGAGNLGRTVRNQIPNLIPGFPEDPGSDLAYFNPSNYYWNNFSTNVFLYRLAYTFKPFKDVTITAGPQFYAADIIDFNSYANAPSSDFGNYFFINNTFIIPYPLNYAGGAGAAVQWNPGGGPFTLKALYLASNAASVNRSGPLLSVNGFDFDSDNAVGGFWGDPYQGSIELEYKTTFGGGKNKFAVRLQGTRALVNRLATTAVGVNAEATFGRFGVFGRAGYAFLNPSSSLSDPLPFAFLGDVIGQIANTEILPFKRNYQAISFMAGVAYKDLLVPGSLVAVAAGAPFITQGRGSFSLPGFGGINDRNQVNVEAFYRFPVNDNISITPIFTVIFNANNSSFNDPIYQGVLRTTFTF